MDVARGILYMEFAFLTLILVEATTITVDDDHCGGDISLDVNDSLSLNYHGGSLKEKYIHSEKKCIFKISASRSNCEICIRYKDQGRHSVSQLSKCYLAFKYYIGSYDPYSWNSKNCRHFDDDPLCTPLDTVYAVFKYYTHINYLYEGVWLEFEIYLRKPPAKREEKEETWSSWSSWSSSDTSWSSWSNSDTSWSSWSNSDTSWSSWSNSDTSWSSWSNPDTPADSEHDSSYELFFVLGIVGFIFIFCLCCCTWSYYNTNVRANVQNSEALGQRDNQFTNIQADSQSSRIVNRYRSEGPPAEASEDPWKPPEYESVVLLEQSFYGDSKPCKVYVSKEKVSGPDNTDDQDDPPPPYPGV